ncbi:MAG: hypothetical protein EOO15_15665 [Chitinophagaceae bacterium]|nr:MAG: hypothetical protein EOO15_15665 [Chitinophagaceae bacterium]
MRYLYLLLTALLCAGRLAAQPGTLDAAFPVGGIQPDAQVYALVPDPDNKVLLVGNFGKYNNVTRLRVARANADGSNDGNFTPGTGANSLVWSAARTTSGQYYLAGQFSTYNSTGRVRVARINSDGTLDTNFDPGTGPNNTVRSLALQSDGKVIIGGDFTSVAGTAANYLARLNADGTLDNTFQLGTALNGLVRSLIVQPDDKIIAVGQFTLHGANVRKYIVRLNADGSLDNNFTVGTGFNNYVQSVALQPDGKVIAGGVFTAYNGTPRDRIARLLPGGAIDPSFVLPSGVTDWVYAIKVQADGKILIGGDFVSAGGTTVNRVARLQAGGALDNSFTAGSGASSTVRSIEIVNERILLSGDYLTFNGISKKYYTRLYGDNSATVGSLALSYCPSATFAIPFTASGLFNAGNTFTAQLSDASGSFAAPVAIGTVSATGSGSINATIPANTASGSGYRMRIVSSAPASTGADNGSNLTIGLVNSATISYDGSPYCSSTGMAQVTFSGNASGNYSATPGLVLDPVTGAIDIGASAAGLYTVQYGNGSSCGVATSTQVSIRPALSISPVPNQSVCSGQPSAAVAFSGANGLTYNWTNDNPAIGLAASGSGAISSFLAQNGGNAIISGHIVVTASGGTGCKVSNPVAFNLSVRPVPTVNAPGNQVLCAGASSTPVVFSGILSGTSYLWSNNNTSTGLSAAGAGNIAAFVTKNNTGSVQTSTIQVTPVNSGCSGVPQTFEIAVSPAVAAISYPANTYCQSGSANAVLVGSTGGTWSGGAGLSINAASGEVNLRASSPGSYTVTYAVPALNGCSAQAQASFTVNPQAVVDPIPNQVYCDGLLTAAIGFSGTASTYSWTNTNPAIGLASAGQGNSLPAFTTVNPGPGVQYAYIKVTPLGNGTTNCPGKGISFRVTVNACPPVAQPVAPGDGNGTLRSQLQAGPVPARSFLRISYTGKASRLSVEIRDNTGRPVQAARTFGSSSLLLSTESLLPGTYYAVVSDPATGATAILSFVRIR